MEKVASNQGAAQDAVSGISKVSVKSGEPCSIGRSNISSMKQGAKVSNQILSDLSKLVSCVNEQANKFPKLAEVIASRDSQTRFK
ncbi:hypothetical protein CKN73_01635 [Carnobacterium divergens]|uniref:hypothetical protein n=1 Tax=Carnobacterium divergens TaxID=2748 RepID=UPI001072DC54|nr:hypothetical protein [Carnobacterium divergens]TFJ44268.1 hypothetical protein CKN77_01610 [Carnobacterium divergens]TFJ52239.1 hypothetical protein CKN73_01635 [Carnobacterium divergens]TFJ57405.1 hypothetical protein CKN83_01625 [Carnobacterium divergens]TFJ65831.1 hypothetical protein CKN89_01635 [Carnobacterium divergens]TFJ74136.1 hypothetical protein CKN91_01630 [Carnobacterium divergens]